MDALYCLDAFSRFIIEDDQTIDRNADLAVDQNGLTSIEAMGHGIRIRLTGDQR